MSYSYGHGEYHNESASALSSSSQHPQWETIEQHQTDPQQQPQQQSEIVLSPTQPNPFFSMADEYLTTGQLHQLHSPTDPSHHPLLSNRSSYDSTSDGRFNSLSPGDIGTPTSTPADPTTNPSRSGRGRQALRRVQARAIANPYPPSSMHAMQPPPLPPGREHRVGDTTPAMHRSPPGITTSPTTSTGNILGSPMAGAQSGGFLEVNRISPYSPSSMLPPAPTPPTCTSRPISEHPVQAQVQRPQAQSQPQRRWVPRSDMHYDPQSHVLSVSMELPGVKKAQLRLTLSTCMVNRVRQLTVKGRSDPVFASGSSSLVGNNNNNMDGARATEGDGDAMDGGPRGGGGQGDHVGDALHRYAVRERKYGDFSRILNVPSETRPEDIQAEMEDGVLTLKIACGPPAESPDTQVIPIQ